MVQLSIQHFSLRFRATADLPPLAAPLSLDTDILQFAAEHPPWWLPASYHPTMTKPDGTKVVCRYWDCKVDGAEDFLRDKYTRPYTLSRMLRWYEGPSWGIQGPLLSRLHRSLGTILLLWNDGVGRPLLGES